MKTRHLAVAAALVVTGAACRQEPLGPHDPGPGLSRATASATPLVFRQVSSGGFHTCAVAADDRAYCWGYNAYGQLGNGTNGGPDSCFGWPCSRLPVAAAGELRFRIVTAGFAHSCGITTDDRAFCWGRNDLGQLGHV